MPLGPVRVLLPPFERGPQVVVLGLQPRRTRPPGRGPPAPGRPARPGPGTSRGAARAPPAPRPPRPAARRRTAGASPAAGTAPPPPGPSSATTSDLSTRRDSRSSTSRGRRGRGTRSGSRPGEVLGAGIGRRPSAREPVGEVVGADRLGRLQRPAAGEDRQAPEAAPARPGSGGRGSSRSPTRSVCWRGRASRPPPVSRRKRSSSRAASCSGGRTLHAGGGQLEGQGQAVQPAADLRHRHRVLRRSGRSPAAPGGPARRTGAPPRTRPAARSAAASRGSGAASEGTRQAASPGDAQRLPAGGQHAQAGAGPQQGVRQARRRRPPGARSCPAPAGALGCGGARSASPGGGRPGSSRRPSAASAVWGTRAGSASGASSTSHTPSG